MSEFLLDEQDQKFLSSLAEFMRNNDEEPGLEEPVEDALSKALERAQWKQEQEIFETFNQIKTLIHNTKVLDDDVEEDLEVIK